jgi:exosome complex component CSL4
MLMIKTKQIQIVVPGELIGTCEEFLPGHNTVVVDGRIYAMILGSLQIDTKEMIVHVNPLNPPVLLAVKNIVIGVVSDIKGSMAIVDITHVLDKYRNIAGDTIGAIHISKVSELYTQDIQREFRVSDIVKAKVIQVKPSIQLATNSPELGVVFGLCYRCRHALIKQRNLLYCNNCDRVETRKTSTDYGNINILCR